jgi:general secretion pathway protein K
MRTAPLKTQGAQALLLVLWAMFVMSFAILGLLQLLKINVGTAVAMDRLAIASSLAFAGITMGRNPAFVTDGKVVTQQFENGSSLEVSAVSENSKLNINRVLAGGDRNVLQSLFRIWGLSNAECSTVIDCLQDYVEPGDVRRMNGAKRQQYRAAGRQGPSGKPFRSIEEMSSVLNFDLVTRRKENWRDYFTIYGAGSLDLTTAPADLIRAVCRVGDSGAQSLLKKRSPENGGLKDLDAARVAMGMTNTEFNDLSSRLSVGGNVRRVKSVGALRQSTRTIEAVYVVGSGTSSILEWKEW